jgi:hypothetical protein
VTDALDVKETPVGCKADLAQLYEIIDASADGEVAGFRFEVPVPPCGIA